MPSDSRARVAPRRGATRVAIRKVSLAVGVGLGVAMAGACSLAEPSLPPAPYVAPAVGTVYRYAGFSNTVVGAEGLRTRFVDDSGRQGLRVGLFISDDPEHPSQIDPAQLGALWPLESEKQTNVVVRNGPSAWLWRFKVLGVQDVTVPAGRFQTYLVQAVQRPDTIRDPKATQETVVGYTFWYAPSIAAVVRFRTTYYSGPAMGRVVQSELRAVERPSAAPGGAPTGR